VKLITFRRTPVAAPEAGLLQKDAVYPLAPLGYGDAKIQQVQDKALGPNVFQITVRQLPPDKVNQVENALDQKFGVGQTKVILPITDPYVVHHGALGSFATVYLYGAKPEDVTRYIASQPGIDVVVTRKEGCARFELPEDRTGDLIVVSGGKTHSKVIGTSRDKHDLSGLTEPLRSHGGLSEQEIPIIVNRKTHGLAGPLRNFDAFAIGCNHIAAHREQAA